MKTTLIAALLGAASLILPCAHAQQSDADTKQFMLLLSKAEKGDAQAQSKLAEAYFFGSLGLATNEVKALKWLRKAAAQNLVIAQLNLGNCYYKGEGVPKDATEAMKWYRKAAEQNDPQAQYNLGVGYRDGQGVTKDEAEAVKWFGKAAESGEVKAWNALAWILATSENSAIRDGANAVAFAEKAVAATNRKTPADLDTLAAAYAEAGQFEKAVPTEQEAIALVQTAADKNDYTTRLKLFEAHVPYRAKG